MEHALIRRVLAVRALDDWTLEVRLENPAAYFPYIVALPVTYPLPMWAIEKHGADWWRPGNIQSNGFFGWSSFDPENGVVIRTKPDLFWPGLRERAAHCIWEYLPAGKGAGLRRKSVRDHLDAEANVFRGHTGS